MNYREYIEPLERDLAYVQHLLNELQGKRGPRAAGYRLHLREKEMELLERIGKRLDGPP